ncbi:4-hydroxybenzoate 3-monooxygenase [Frankia sp. QA3]|uniref:4-hydroxybenzoate 3-monooxygenase n=1 Tax=Frankia sp. QA3 TaxID=710111 RepID=UPI000269BDF0|nr:4-hydroxybenzoate 3-monooxygenase [Frankia sp. QA3]EIV92829.1 2-polyprenyl-6-methoxyphenol hydroxylase-like oxidoreductase [Frankia sp. QA3]
MRTRVGIVGGGPAGLLLSHLLHLEGIDSVVIEARTREYCERRQRAGILEQASADVLRAAGVGDRMDRVGLVHEGVELRFEGERHRVDFVELTGRTVTVYAQTEVVKDLIARRCADGGQVLFEAEAYAVEGIDTDAPVVRFRHGDADVELRCEVVVGVDGYHGLCRRSLPAGASRTWERTYPFGWLGVLAEVAPSCDELIYARHDNGFALHSMRSSTVSRLYLQVPPATDANAWTDDQIWDELDIRFALDDWKLERGPIIEKNVTPMRSFVTEPMRHGRLFLAGDAAHIVPPTGAKGLNLAVADVTLLAGALRRWLLDGDQRAADDYSATALRRIWRAQQFSNYMTTMLHTDPTSNPFDGQLALSQLRYAATSRAAATTLAENYVGLWHP